MGRIYSLTISLHRQSRLDRKSDYKITSTFPLNTTNRTERRVYETQNYLCSMYYRNSFCLDFCHRDYDCPK